MTWKEFKEAVEAKGIKDDDIIGYMDFTHSAVSHLEVTIYADFSGLSKTNKRFVVE